MPYQQKSKIYFHVSLDRNCADLLIQDAQDNGFRPAAWIRELMHRHLRSDQSSVSELYEWARQADEQAWTDSYAKRFESRKKPSVEEGS